MWQRQVRRCSLRESINAVEDDIHHANTLVAGLPRDIIGGDSIKMKLGLSPFAPMLVFVLEWMDCSCFDTFLSCLGLFHVLVYKVYVDGMPIASPEERRASLTEFYGVIYPMLKQLEGNLAGLGLVEENNHLLMKDKNKTQSCSGSAEEEEEEEEEECGICMEMDCKVVVLPNCGHSMCMSCFEEWHLRSRSCPYCRGSLKRVASGDLWVLTTRCDAVDAITLAKDNLTRFYLYIQNLPLFASQDAYMYNYLM